MKISSHLLAIALSVSLSSILAPVMLATPAFSQTQDTRVALQRGFRTGYSDGYMAGYRDTIDSIERNYSRHADYTKADRAYNKDYGSLDEYRDGYRQGFASGYDTGFEKRTFESTLPPDLKTRGIAAINEQNQAASGISTQTGGEVTVPANREPAGSTNEGYTATVSQNSNSNAVVVIPRDTELVLELQNDLNTQQSREGERFTAKVVSPSELAGATVEGRVSKIRQPGRVTRRSEMLLSFDRIVLSDDRWSNFSGILTEVMAVKGDNVQRVDVEGTALGQNSVKQDAIKVGGTTGAGLVVGAVVGGPVGAAVGAGMGAAFGVGAVVINRGKQVHLTRNQQLRVKAAYETQIR